jgi:transposase
MCSLSEEYLYIVTSSSPDRAEWRLILARYHIGRSFDAWLQACETVTAVQVQNFALGLRQDEAAVRAALTLPWSNGQTEGQVNRLKFIKRQMYGRANFDLFRLRVLHPP